MRCGGKTRAFLLVTLDPNVVARGGDALLALFLVRDPTGESDNTDAVAGTVSKCKELSKN